MPASLPLDEEVIAAAANGIGSVAEGARASLGYKHSATVLFAAALALPPELNANLYTSRAQQGPTWIPFSIGADE
ncbi:hypothetical protein [Archangium violaceum]|uniref:hypothetical protein n=1 Tax=Archangium violaceum TaxID=83451 RepID=UPI0037C0FB5C